ncbi:MAG: 4-hydroxythreonine-4-phosphate dehydrogenase PdxA [Hydrotalea sp.]|nr:4-hydroxythreonine-4-phosphate dehydrogenase PdxA [Hydrotalea sp.]
MENKTLAITSGDPGGIGGEVFLKSWLAAQKPTNNMLLIDDPTRVQSLIDFLQLPITITIVDDINHALAQQNNQKNLLVFPLAMNVPFRLGKPRNDAEKLSSARAALASLNTAIDLVEKKIVQGMVTAPLDKSIINAVMPGFAGHTDYLAARDHKDDNKKPHAMMLLAREDDGNFFRVVPLTTHIPLRNVATTMTTDLLQQTARLVADELHKKFGIATPRLAVAGINPHAGDGGIMGREEIDIMQPVIKKLQADQMAIDGPLSADSLFTPLMRKKHDAFLCPSHDQALIPMKTLFFDRAVNLTLGLSYIRVSPDHGTGFDIADKKIANHSSMLAAITLAQDLLKKI